MFVFWFQLKISDMKKKITWNTKSPTCDSQQGTNKMTFVTIKQLHDVCYLYSVQGFHKNEILKVVLKIITDSWLP